MATFRGEATRWAIAILSTAIALLPSLIAVGLYAVVGPSNFWQKFALVGIGLYLIGGVQIFLLVGLMVWLFILFDD